MFYRVVLTGIATLLIILCFEIGHIERVIAENNSDKQETHVQKIVICNKTGEYCVEPELSTCDTLKNMHGETIVRDCALPVKER